MTLSHSPTFLPFQSDWHKADIIAALHKKGHFTGCRIPRCRFKFDNSCQCVDTPMGERGTDNKQSHWRTRRNHLAEPLL